MVDDAKIHFYLTHRKLIQEWAALADPAAQALDRALLTAAHQLAAGPEGELLKPRIQQGGATLVRLDVTTDPLPAVWLELAWERNKLLRHGAHTWPSLRLVTNPDNGPALREALKAATITAPARHGMVHLTNGWWVRHGDLSPEQEPIDIDDFANTCVHRFAEAHVDLRGSIYEAVGTHASGASTQT